MNELVNSPDVRAAVVTFLVLAIGALGTAVTLGISWLKLVVDEKKSSRQQYNMRTAVLAEEEHTAAQERATRAANDQPVDRPTLVEELRQRALAVQDAQLERAIERFMAQQPRRALGLLAAKAPKNVQDLARATLPQVGLGAAVKENSGPKAPPRS